MGGGGWVSNALANPTMLYSRKISQLEEAEKALQGLAEPWLQARLSNCNIHTCCKTNLEVPGRETRHQVSLDLGLQPPSCHPDNAQVAPTQTVGLEGPLEPPRLLPIT